MNVGPGHRAVREQKISNQKPAPGITRLGKRDQKNVVRKNLQVSLGNSQPKCPPQSIKQKADDSRPCHFYLTLSMKGVLRVCITGNEGLSRYLFSTLHLYDSPINDCSSSNEYDQESNGRITPGARIMFVPMPVAVFHTSKETMLSM